MEDKPKISISDEYYAPPNLLDLYAKTINPVRVIEALTPAHAEGCYATETYNPMLRMVEDIHRAVCVESLPEKYAVNRLTKLLEDRKCPTDDCKKCKYYEPGGLEPCDMNRVIAEYLIYGRYIKVNPPNPGDEY